MKRVVFIVFSLLLASFAARAVPAYPYPFKYRQPDGSEIEIVLHGDEFYHYATSNGRVVALGEDGFYRPAKKPFYSTYSAMRSRALMPRVGTKVSRSGSITMGEKKCLVILVEFADLEFTIENPQQAFHNMLNQVGYSDNGGTGSVFDYYYENSSHKFIPSYDVVGPVKLSKGYADYGENDEEKDQDKDPQSAFVEACSRAVNLVDFSKYDNDNDGYVDFIYFYYAGYNEAEGASKNTIWPHSSWIKNFSANGVRVGSYACSSEYRGRSGTTMAGIGTFCHEFGHVLGLPDFYDTDYEKNGTSTTVYAFSLMCSGNYNNNGRTPPYLGALERWLLGWKDDLPEWETSGSKTIRPVYENDGYTTPTSVDGEFFLYEVRDGSGWDAYVRESSKDPIPQGMLVYHVDMSQSNIIESMPAIKLWGSNDLNCYNVHPCYYIVRPGMSYSNYYDMMFPGSTGTTGFEGKDWADLLSGFVLSNISYNAGTASLNLDTPDKRVLSGKVVNSKGQPMSGVNVSLIPKNAAGVQALMTQSRFVDLRSLKRMASFSTVTGSDGTFSFDIALSDGREHTIIFTADYYSTISEEITLSRGKNSSLDVIMYNFSQGIPGLLKKYSVPSPDSALGFSNSDATSWSATCAVHFTAEELASHVGYRFNTINYMIKASKADIVDVFIDFGGERAFTRTVTPQFNNVHSEDISDAGIFVPEGKDVYIGYSVKNINNRYFMSVDETDGVEGGAMIRGVYSTSGSIEWEPVSKYNFIISSDLQKMQSPFNSLGIRIISNPSGGKAYPAGTVLPLTFDNPGAGGSAVSTEWFFDGAPVSESTVTLSASGKHTIKAVLTYADGSKEEISQVVQVQ